MKVGYLTIVVAASLTVSGIALAAGLPAPATADPRPLVRHVRVMPLYSGVGGRTGLVRLGGDHRRGQNTTAVSGTGIRSSPHIGGIDMSRRR